MGISNVASNLQPGVCTSTTRPTSPFVGQAIFETDTLLARIWNGTAWQEYPYPLNLTVSSVTANDFYANTGKFRANRANATSGSTAGGIDFQIDGSTWAQIFMSTASEMRYSSNGNRFDAPSNTFNGAIRVEGRFTNPNQPFCILKGQGGNWFQPSGPLIANGPAGFSWAANYNVGGHWNGNSFIAPVDGVYLCSFQTYQQTYGGTSWIHWNWLIGGSMTWNGGETPYNIFGYSDSAYADGAGTTMMLYVTAGNGIQIGGYMGGDERFYSNYTYMSFRLLG